jgi:phosphoribosyl 1,2-cyclic phosphate phosphodiesterase
MKAQFKFLGTGASAGIPVIACQCDVCKSSDPHNKRLRSSALITTGDKILLIDAGPDFRQQALTHQINRLDGVLITHTHYDHTAGIDDLRSFYFKARRPLPCLLSVDSLNDLQKRLYYLFEDRTNQHSLIVKLAFQVLQERHGKAEFVGLPIQYVTYEQGGMAVNGFRFGDLAYISDIREYSDTIYDELKGIKTLVISALRDTVSPLHFSVSEAVAFSQRVGAQQTWLTHIAHDLDHEKTNLQLPKQIQLGYDGQTFEFEW